VLWVVTAAGMLAGALNQRRVSGLPSFTVLSCDNMPENGSQLQ
jgi:mannitol-1-phosphate/altronate dehydrogenase